jgi:hypothetical protein
MVEVDALFRPRARGVRPGKEVLLGSLYLDVLDIMFYAHRPKGALESHLSIIPRSDGTFPAIKLDD